MYMQQLPNVISSRVSIFFADTWNALSVINRQMGEEWLEYRMRATGL